jgi:hypothetical protein
MKNHLLSVNNDKIKIYESDPYYRDSLDDINNYFSGDILYKFHNVAPVIFRPDSIVSRHCFNVLEKILAHGYIPIYAAPYEYCRFKVRECWKYQLNIASRDRIDVMDLILKGFPSLYVVFFKDFLYEEVSATSYLSQRKGPSLPADRKVDHLRYSVESAQVSVLTYIHVSDEPIDIIREMGAFFCRDQRIEIIESIDNPTPLKIEHDLQVLADLYKTHTLKYEDVLRKAESNFLVHGKENELMIAFQKLEKKEISWRDMKIIMEENHPIFNYWDIVSVCAQFAETHYKDKNPIVEDEL